LTSPDRLCRLATYAEEAVKKPLSSFIDHTVLKPEATAKDIESLCAEAKQHQFAAVCVNGSRVGLCKQQLQGTNLLFFFSSRWSELTFLVTKDSAVNIAAVIGFPLGADEKEIKERAAVRV